MQKLKIEIQIDKISPDGSATGFLFCSTLCTPEMLQGAIAGFLGVIFFTDPRKFEVDVALGNIHSMPNTEPVVNGTWEAWNCYREKRNIEDKDSLTTAIGENID